VHRFHVQHFPITLPDFSSDRVNRGILALSVEDDAGSGADGVIDRYGYTRGDRSSRWLFSVVRSRSVPVGESLCLCFYRSALLADALFVSLVVSAVGASIG
jgi:hypothetical protein